MRRSKPAGLLLLILLSGAQAMAALASTMQWEVRSTGNDGNGGAFNPFDTSPGTDFSQQDAAQFSYTDIVIAATTTNGTSVARPFSSVDVGNVINITAGAGCT